MSETATPTLLEDLQAKRSEKEASWDTLIDEREEQRKEYEGKDERSDEETKAFDAAELDFRSQSEELEGEIKSLSERVAQQLRKEERLANSSGPSLQIKSEPATYRKDNANEHSFYRDVLSSHSLTRNLAPRGASERLERHQCETAERVEKREQQFKREAEVGVEQGEAELRASLPAGARRGIELDSPFEKRANPSRETGHGGEFVPPLWLVEDDFIPYLRAGRVVAPLCRNMPVPPGTDTIKLPKISVPTEVAPQLLDNAGVASRDIETTYVEAAVKTLAGQEDVAIQLIEQSPGQVFDRVVQEDLLADYNLKVDQNVIFGTGSEVTRLNAGTIKGLLPISNWSGKENKSAGTAYTAQTTYSALNCNWSWIAKERYNVQNVHHVMNTRRAALFATQTDSASEAGKPFVNASDFPNFNIGAELGANTPAEGFVMRTPLGPNVYATVNIPATGNEAYTSLTGSTYDAILSAKFDDVWFFESDLRTRVLPEVLSGTLQIRFQVYAYVALLVRYGPSLAVACGKPFSAAEAKFGGFLF